MTQCIAIYDISGIQSFIFSTNKLREMVGGSKIVHKILFELLPKKLRYDNDNWENEDFSKEIPKGRFGNVIYIGGGNALVLYENEKSYQSVTIELQKEVFELSGGGIRLCHAKIEIDHLNQKGSFVEKIQKPLMQALTTYKQNTAPIQTARGFAFGAQDNETKEPIVSVPTSKDSPCKYASYGRFKKNEIFYSTRDEKSSERISKYYADNFEQFRDEGEKSFVAVIHIDGNTMGKQIIDFAKKNEENATLFDQLQNMRELSKEISKIYRDTLDSTVNEIFKKEIKTEKAYRAAQQLTKNIPYREIIADGDDITVIIKSQKALQFCDLFVKTLEKEKEGGNYSHLKDFHISVGIGIAFVHDKFPFSTAYDIAEQLCKNAKKRGLEYPFSKNNIDVTHSSMDFQIIKSGMPTDIKNFRASNYYLDKNNQKPKCLLRRPYLYIKENDKNIPKEYTYTNFIDTYEELVNLGIANNKLKALQHAYATSEMEIDYVIQMIKARKKCELQPWMGNKATYFDILDVWDYLKGGK
ncbi:Cas10/Cmr2 second palm domain-containing protein [Streptococcus cristatus]|uniref:Cas10/Cmr2 second palm domain-containing protein n=1 Tax=Streptococcus cristatus TaxID=45634 RepID=UPI0005EF1548|nr:hypothetical protein [Streptococcus cristatus]KJQ62165.1 hypothetical protein TW70_00322 [Streptococcus cristatus]QIP49352.1 hypothetical protein HBA50_04910 [Streptococcus cristatus ATCC 51100]